MVIVEVDIVRAAPHHLDGLAYLFRQDRRFGHIIGFRFPPEPAAEQRHVAEDILLPDPQDAGHRCLHSLRILGRRPYYNLAVLILGHGRWWLQRRMRQMRHVILGLVHLAGAREHGIDVAGMAHHFLRLACGLDQRLLVSL